MTTSAADHQRVRVLLADDHAKSRSGILDVLRACAGVAVVAETADGREALELSGVQRPDVALIDIALPGVDGIELTRRLVESGPRAPRVVVLSIHDDHESILRALRNGATGFVLKSAGPAEVEMAVRAAARGDSFLCPSIARQVIGRYLEHAGSRNDRGNGLRKGSGKFSNSSPRATRPGKSPSGSGSASRPSSRTAAGSCAGLAYGISPVSCNRPFGSGSSHRRDPAGRAAGLRSLSTVESTGTSPVATWFTAAHIDPTCQGFPRFYGVGLPVMFQRVTGRITPIAQ